jgi:AcrR family transcriptional regulator
MRNPEETKKSILKNSGLLFNTKGYKATSIKDITDATGFTKGAIYRHFKSKEVLEKETLFHLSTLMFEGLRKLIKAKQTAPEKLTAVFTFFESYIANPPIKGGCPLMNVAIEADDAHPILRRSAVKLLDMLRESIITLLENGVKYKQLKPGIDIEFFASLIIASLEGAIMMSKLKGNNEDIKHIVKHLNAQLKTLEL